MSIRKIIEDYTITVNPLPVADVVDIDVYEYHPYYPSLPIGRGVRPMEFFASEEEVERAMKDEYDRIPKTYCWHCGHVLGFTRQVDEVLKRFEIERKAGRCPECATIVYDYRDEHALE